MRSLLLRIGKGVGGAAIAAVLLAGPAAASSESCREWRAEHRYWKTEALRQFLRGGPRHELDAAVFEMLQREAYLTSCEISVQGGRDELVGWRLPGRAPEEYGSAVAESVLARAGFDLELEGLFPEPPPPAAAPEPPWQRLLGGAR